MARAQLFGIALCCVVAAAMLTWPLFGNPPYGFYTPMKWGVGISSIAGAYVSFQLSPYAWPLSLLLILSAGVGLFGKMSRQDWVPFNWASLFLLVIATVVATHMALRMDKGAADSHDSVQRDSDIERK